MLPRLSGSNGVMPTYLARTENLEYSYGCKVVISQVMHLDCTPPDSLRQLLEVGGPNSWDHRSSGARMPVRQILTSVTWGSFRRSEPIKVCGFQWLWLLPGPTSSPLYNSPSLLHVCVLRVFYGVSPRLNRVHGSYSSAPLSSVSGLRPPSQFAICI